MDDDLYGKELSRYKLDYLGGHKNIDAILMNSEVILYEKGLIICSSLQKSYIYLGWDEIECIVYCKESTEKIEIDYEEEKTIILEKSDEDINVMEMLLMIKAASNNTEILTKAEIHEGSEEAFFALEEKDLRIQALLAGVDEKDMLEADKKWESYFSKTLKFPFEAKISKYEESGLLQEGDNVTVLGVSGEEDLYGILVRIVKKKKHYIFPLCDLEVTDEKHESYIPIDDYCNWFANYR